MAFRAFRWTLAGGTQDLGSLAGANGTSAASAISDDSAVTIGQSATATQNVTHAFRWDVGQAA